MREPFAAELKDPSTRRLLKAIISAENPGAGSAVVESLMNRTAMVNEARAAKGQPPLTLKAMIQGDASIGGGKSFYGPVRTGAVNEHLFRVDSDKDYSARLDSNIASALGGADTIKGHTDQGSKGDPNYVTGGVGVNINGERFNDWGYGGARAWREKQQALAAGPVPLDPTPNVGASESTYADQAQVEAAKKMVDPTPNVGSGASGYAETPTEVASTLGKSIGEKARDATSDAFGDLGKLLAEGPVAKNAARPSGPANLPVPTNPTPAGVFPTVDPKVAEIQRQQLAMALQRLNSGKLR
jgi:hypothetical protein